MEVSKIYNTNISMFNVSLRKIERSDLNMICEWRNHEYIRKFMDDRRIVSLAVMNFWLNKVMKSNDTIAFIILNKCKISSGVLEIKNINFDKSYCEQGIFLSPDSIGTGLGTLVTLCQEYVLHILAISTIYLTIRNNNIYNIRFWKKLGATVCCKNSEYTIFRSEKDMRRKFLRNIAYNMGMGNVWDSFFI